LNDYDHKVEDVIADNHSTHHREYFVFVAKIGVRTDEDESTYITLVGKSSYQEI
jgi:hypothetical protein